MGLMMDDSEEPMAEKLRAMAADFNPPPATPREAMWERIQAARKATSPGAEPSVLPFRPRRGWNTPAVRVAIGIAAVLLIGIGIGRLTVAPGTDTRTPGSTTPLSSQPPARDRENLATTMVASQHFSRVESFLTEFNTRPGDSTFSGEAKSLLVTTRLLLDSKRVTDPRTRKLLDDLELVLIQIATLDAKNRPQDLDFITEDLTQNHLRTRLHNAVPAGPAIRM
jgi:hypothetical protein